MKTKPYFERLQKAKEYKQFITQNPDKFLVAGFFVLDLETGTNMHQIDFYVPSKRKVAAFNIDKGIQMQMMDTMGKKLPEKLDLNTKVDLDALTGIVKDEMHNRGISEDIKKIIAVLQTVDGKKIWNLNCVLTGMGMLRTKIEDDSKTVLKVEKINLMDIMKKMPSQAPVTPTTEKSMKDELQKLSDLETEITKEREVLKKELDKKGELKIAKKGK